MLEARGASLHLRSSGDGGASRAASLTPASRCSSGGKAKEDQDGEDQRRHEEVVPTDDERAEVAECESPGEPGELPERRGRQASQLPGDHGGEEQEDRNEETEPGVEAVVGTIEALYVESGQLQYGERLIDAPGRIGFAKAERVANGEQQDQNRRDAVKNRCAHIELDLAPMSISDVLRNGSRGWAVQEVRLFGKGSSGVGSVRCQGDPQGCGVRCSSLTLRWPVGQMESSGQPLQRGLSKVQRVCACSLMSAWCSSSM